MTPRSFLRSISRPRVVAIVATATLALATGVWLLVESGAAEGPHAGAGPGRLPDASVSGSPAPASTVPPLLQMDVNPGDVQDLAKVSKFFSKHVQQDVRIDLHWFSRTGRLNATPDGSFEAIAACSPRCALDDIQYLTISADGVENAADVTFDGLAGKWSMTGTFFVQSAVGGNQGSFDVRMRVSGSNPTVSPDSATEADRNRCAALTGTYRAYPGYTLSRTDSEEFDPYVLLVQDVLNFTTPSPTCIPEDGIFTEETEDAVREFQGMSGLTVDGIVGPNTYSVLMLTFEGDYEPEAEPVSDPILSVGTHDQFRRWAVGQYSVNTSRWTYDTSACVLWADVIHRSKLKRNLTRKEVVYILGPTSDTGYTLRTQQSSVAISPGAINEIVAAGNQCIDFITRRE